MLWMAEMEMILAILQTVGWFNLLYKNVQNVICSLQILKS